MSDLVTETQVDGRWCPVCPDETGQESWVEPEMDGDHRYFECEECGFAFGYERITEGAIEGSCAIGVPESVRKRASAPMEHALKDDGPQSLAGPTLPIGKPE